jgi:hypothetical protein
LSATPTILPFRKPRRICASCSAEQYSATARAETCVICGAPLQAEAPKTEPNGDEAPARGWSSLPRGFGAKVTPINRIMPPTEAAKAIAEVVAIDRRVSVFFFHFPFIGPWRLYRDTVYSGREKLRHVFACSLPTVAFLALVALIAYAPFGGASSESSRAEGQIRNLGTIVQRFRREFGRLPEVVEWQRSVEHGELTTYFDPWRRPFVYVPKPPGFEIGTYGCDGQPGGEGADADVFVSFPETPPAPADDSHPDPSHPDVSH